MFFSSSFEFRVAKFEFRVAKFEFRVAMFEFEFFELPNSSSSSCQVRVFRVAKFECFELPYYLSAPLNIKRHRSRHKGLHVVACATLGYVTVSI